VRRTFLCGAGFEHRKDWSEARLRELAGIFSLDVCGFALMDNHEHDQWLCPIENRSRRGAKRTGMLEGLSLTGYLKLLDWSSRLLRSGKKGVSREAAPLLERLRIDADSWQATLRRFFSGEKLLGNFFGAVSRLQEAAATTGRHWLKDIGGRARLTAPPTVG
jgi:hypothetical protein